MARPYTIMEAEPSHLDSLAARLRAFDCLELMACGKSARAHLQRCYDLTIMRKTAFVEGEIAAMWGLHPGPLLGDTGHPWFLTTAAVERVPIAVVKEARRHIAEMLEVRPRLVNYVLASYTGAMRLIGVLGFRLGPPEPIGKNGVLFRRFEMERP
jgi:hypothetical protein